MTTTSWQDWQLCISPEEMARLEYYDALDREADEKPPEDQPDHSDARQTLAAMEAAAAHVNQPRRTRMDETVLDGTNEEPSGHRILDGSDLEIAYNRSGDNLVLRVNKGPVQVFRVMLVDAFKHFDDRRLFDFNSVSPDFVFKVGDVREGLMAIGRAAGLDAEQMRTLDAKAREIAK